MSTDEPDAEDLAEAFPHVAKLEQQLKEADIDVGDIPQRKGTTRRDLLAGSAGLLGLGGILTGATGSAQAGDDQAGQFGSQAAPLDGYVEDLYDKNGNRVAELPGDGSLDVLQELSSQSVSADQSLTDPGGRRHTGSLPFGAYEEIRPGDDWQAKIDSVADGDYRRSGLVRATVEPGSRDFFDFSNTTLPITVKGGVTLDITGQWINYGTAVNDHVFEIVRQATVLASSTEMSLTGGGSGSAFLINGDTETISASHGTHILGYPEIVTSGETPVRFEQTAGGSITGVIAEITPEESTNVAEFISTGAGGYVNGNVVRVSGSMDSGQAFRFEGAETCGHNVAQIAHLQINGGTHIGYWDGAGVNHNVIRGTWFDEAQQTGNVWEWTSGTGGYNKAIRRNDGTASGTNNSGDATNEALADMTL